MAERYARLGLIAGGGDLPVHVAEAARAEGRLGCVIALEKFADPSRYAEAETIRIGQIGAIFQALKAANCDAVCFAGSVPRPDFSTIRPDMKGVSLLPKVLAAAARGDDALLRAVVEIFEREGLSVIGADEIADGLKARPGLVGRIGPDDAARRDGLKALRIAGIIGAEDIGQGAVVCDNLVLAVEAQEGTDRMLARVAELPLAVRGTPEARRGVLAKRPKPVQERRVDLPVIGVSTVEGAARAGLAGIAAPAGGALIIGHDAVGRAADAAGLFVWITDGEEDAP
ncbi:MAG: UDP-2,3-diacylglucosamine diphosphatase LpxI [Oceanicaulis sp.]